jgi:16S rRNA (uracil1498-N3)-methyltransferase
VPKGDKLEVVVEKATEVGVSRIVPFIAQRTVVKWDQPKLARIHERLNSIARAAAKQSGAARVPVVETVVPQPSVGPGTLVLHEAGTKLLRDALPDDTPDEIAIVVGPEGGLSDVEVAVMEADGAVAVTLGPRILRTETAGPVAIAVIGFRYGWLG